MVALQIGNLSPDRTFHPAPFSTFIIMKVSKGKKVPAYCLAMFYITLFWVPAISQPIHPVTVIEQLC